MPQREANYLHLDDSLNIEAYQLKRYMEVLDNTANAAIVGNKPLGVLDGDIPADSINSISISDYNYGFLDYNDTISVYDPITMRTLETFTVSADTVQGDTSISITPAVPTYPLYDKYIIALDAREKLATKSLKIGDNYSYTFIRNIHCRTTNATITECTTNGLTGSGITNRILVPEDSSMTCEFTFEVKQQATANHRTFKRVATFVNNGGTVTVPEAVVTPWADYGTVALAACAVAITPNNSDNAIKVEFTGILATNLNCNVTVVCSVSKYG